MESAKVPVKLVKVTRVLGRTGMQDPISNHAQAHKPCLEKENVRGRQERAKQASTEVRDQMQQEQGRAGILWIANLTLGIRAQGSETRGARACMSRKKI